MTRQPYDYYRTMERLIIPLREHVDVFDDMIFVDPCCGDNVILQTLGVPQIQQLTNDLDEKWKAHFNLDATLKETWHDYINHGMHCPAKPHRVCVTNPPFNRAFEILQHAFEHCDYVVMLVRLSFLEPTKERSGWLSRHPPFKLLVTPRVRFDPNSKGTDSVTTAWAFWTRHEFPGLTQRQIEIMPNWRVEG